MFERYTEKARRVIFFARYEASQYGSRYIETEHLLLGLLREDHALANRFLRGSGAIESYRRDIEARIEERERISTSIEVPVSQECRRILNFAAEEADRLDHRHIGTEHLLLGILREEKCLAAELIRQRGVDLSALRQQVAGYQPTVETARWDAAERRAQLGKVLDEFIGVLGARDAGKAALHFAEKGQLWDVRGDQHVGRKAIEAAMTREFAASPDLEVKPDVRDIKSVRSYVAVVTMIWEKNERLKPESMKLQMMLVMREVYDRWEIVSAHVSELRA
jgi:uncharacterized protein (TIGR02246 family)